jgi:hypothetical protein
MTAQHTPDPDVASLREQLTDALRHTDATVTSIVVHPVTALVVLSISLPDLAEAERLRAEEETRIDIAMVEARYSSGGYVFAPVFAPTADETGR